MESGHCNRDRIPDPLWRVSKTHRSIRIALMAYKTTFWDLTGMHTNITLDKVLSGCYNREEAKRVSLRMKHERLEALKDRLDEAEKIVEAAFVTMETSHVKRAKDYIDILTNRYIIGMGARESARAMNYSADWERALHREAIKEFERIMAGQ